MTTLRVERVSYEYGDPFDVDGEIVAVLRHTVQSRDLSLLVEESGDDDELHDGVYLMALGYINDFDGDSIYMENFEDKFGEDYSAVLSRLEADGLVRCDYENFTVDIIHQDDDETTFCSGTRADGSRCTRDVDEIGDVCWQHEEDDQ